MLSSDVPPRFQVLTLFALFLSILLSTVYAVYLVLYVPLERVVMLLALGYTGWQMQHTSSVHQLPSVYSEPSILLNTSSETALPAYTPKSTDSSCSDNSADSDMFLHSIHPPVSLSNLMQPPSPTFPLEPL